VLQCMRVLGGPDFGPLCRPGNNGYSVE